MVFNIVYVFVCLVTSPLFFNIVLIASISVTVISVCSQLDTGVFVLFGGSNSKSYNTIQSYSQVLNVPYVIYSTSRNAPADGYTFDITLSPSYIEAIIDIIKFYSWRKVYYLFDTDDGRH